MIDRDAEVISHEPPLKRIDLNPVRAVTVEAKTLYDAVTEAVAVSKAEAEAARIWKLVVQASVGGGAHASDHHNAPSESEPIDLILPRQNFYETPTVYPDTAPCELALNGDDIARRAWMIPAEKLAELFNHSIDAPYCAPSEDAA